MKKILLMMGVLILVISGCSSTGVDDEFVFAISDDLPGIDHADGASKASFELFSDIYLTLYEVNQDGKLVPGIATNVEVSDDGLTYTYTLRDDAVWVDNTGAEMAKVTANDFVFSWQRMVDPSTTAIYAFIFEPIKNAQAITAGEKDKTELGVKALDDTTLQITLESPTPYFESLVAFYSFGAMSQEGYEQYKDDYATSAATTWYDGPFYVEDFDPAGETQLKKNPLYYDASVVQLENITYRVIKDSTSRYNAFKTGEVDYAELDNPVDVQEAEENGTLQPATFAMSYWVALSQDPSKVTSNENLRKGLAYGFDRDSIEEVAYGGIYDTIEYLIPKDVTPVAYDGVEYRDYAKDSLITFDKEKADKYFDKYMEEMGYTDRSQIEIDYMSGDGSEDQKVAEAIEASYKQLFGITIKIRTLPSKQYQEAKRNADYDMIVWSWAPDYPDPATYLGLWQSTGVGSQNYTAYSNPEYDKEFQEAVNTIDVDERFTKFAALEQKIVDDNVLIPFYQTAKNRVIAEQYNVPNHPIFLISHKYVTINEPANE